MGACTHEFTSHSPEQMEKMISNAESWLRESEPNIGVIGAIGAPKSMIDGQIPVIQKTVDMAPSNEVSLTETSLGNEKQEMGLEPPLTRKQRRAIERKIKKLNSKKK